MVGERDRSQARHPLSVNLLIRLTWSALLIILVGVILPGSNAPVNLLLGYILAIMVINRLFGRDGAVMAIVMAALIAAYRLSLRQALFIEPSQRLGYILFLSICLLLNFYRPHDKITAHTEGENGSGTSSEAYTEDNLPTISTAQAGRIHGCIFRVEGGRLYQWERDCAHMTDLIWNAQAKLREGDREQTAMMLDYADHLARHARRQLQEAVDSDNHTKTQDRTRFRPKYKQAHLYKGVHKGAGAGRKLRRASKQVIRDIK